MEAVVFDPVAARQACLDGINRADLHSDTNWKFIARGVLIRLAQRQQFVHADDLRKALGSFQPRTPSATGPIFLWAKRQGLLRKTNETKYSEATSNHSEHPFWESLIYE